jgi:hypothetical protein
MSNLYFHVVLEYPHNNTIMTVQSDSDEIRVKAVTCFWKCVLENCRERLATANLPAHDVSID